MAWHDSPMGKVWWWASDLRVTEQGQAIPGGGKNKRNGLAMLVTAIFLCFLGPPSHSSRFAVSTCTCRP
jgi:hypothetical protein